MSGDPWTVPGPVDLDAIKARLEACTQGYWVAGIDIEPEDDGYWAGEDVYAVDELPVTGYSRTTGIEEDSERVSAWADAHLRGHIAETHNYFPIPDAEHDANQRLIAHAPADLRALIAEVERLRAATADEWPLRVGGGTAASADLQCGECSVHVFLFSAGDWRGEEDDACSLGELRRRVVEHARSCPGTKR